MLTKNVKLLSAGIPVLMGLSIQAFALDVWDSGDDDGPGTLISISETVQEHGPHDVGTVNDPADWFQVYLTAGVLNHFESTGSADTEAFLYSDSAGNNQVDYNDDLSGSDFSFHIAYSPPSSGIYYLKVKSRFTQSVSYSLSYYSEPSATDAWDDGDDTGAGATVLTIDEAERTHGLHVLSSGDTNDWFKFSLVASNTYRFESTGEWDVQAGLYNDSGGSTEVANDDQGGTGDNFLIDYKPTVSGDYFLKVSTPVSGNYADYTLRYLLVEDQWDPADDVGAGATLLSFTSTNHGPHTLSTTDTNDWFYFSLEAGNTYEFGTAVASPSTQDTKGWLYSDPAGTVQVDDDDDSGDDLNFLISYTPTNSGTYYLKVEELYNSPAGYWLEYSLVSVGDTDKDGMSDADEAIAGTNPNDKFSYFAITNWSVGSFVIEWPAFSNRQYQVYRSDSLTNSYNPVGPVIYYPQNSYTGSTTEAGGFYKVEVQLQ